MTTAPVDEIIEGSLLEQSGPESLFDFNKKGLLASKADTPEASFGAGRVKQYTANNTGLQIVRQDWGPNSVTYRAFQQIVTQPKKPQHVQIMKRTTPVAEVQTITFSGAIQSDEEILGVVNGIAVSVPYDTDSDTTLGNLKTALELIEGVDSAVVAVNVVTLTATAEWTIPVSLACEGASNPTTVAVAKSAGRTAADDVLEALQDPVLNDWYLLTAAEHDKGLNLALMLNQEALGRGQFLPKTSEATIKQTNNTTNLASRGQALNLRRSGIFLHHDMTEHLSTVLGTYMMASKPGKFQASHRRNIRGVTPSPNSFLNPSDIAVIRTRNVNTYTRIGKDGMIEPGFRCDGKPLEQTWDLDFALGQYIEGIYAWMSTGENEDKTDYSEDGRASLLAAVQAVTLRMQDQGVARNDLPTTAEVMEFSAQDPADVSAGYYEVEASFYYARGTQKVIFRLTSIDAGGAS